MRVKLSITTARVDEYGIQFRADKYIMKRGNSRKAIVG